jgi:hypothetical protein
LKTRNVEASHGPGLSGARLKWLDCEGSGA